jgi:N-acetylneuraminate synthase
LESLDAPAYKIASSEIVDVNLIHYAAKTGKPIILSTGMADFAEIKEALTACKEAGNTKTLLLHCVAGYPTPKEQANLATLSALKQFECLVGLSDHSEGADVSAAAIAAGAVLVEKHFCLSRDIKTVDSDFSLDPDELAMLVARCRETWSMIGCVLDGPADVENQARAYRRSLYATRAVKKGEILTTSNIKSIRPSNGLHPRYLKLLLGTRSKRALKAGEPLRTDDLPST